MKTFYQEPEMELIAFAAEDVITTSGTIADKVGEDTEEGWGGLQ
jgi:hypothetical protein